MSQRWQTWELPVVMLFAWLALLSIPLALGEIGISWDALNHHIYLGWTAQEARFERDFLAASYQSYQFPYLYWPVYRLAVGGWSGVGAGMVLASLHSLAVPPVWMLARQCMPGVQWFDAAMRALAVCLAFMSALILSLSDSTSNDLLAAIPFVWALALATAPLYPSHLKTPAWERATRRPAALQSLTGGATPASFCALPDIPPASLPNSASPSARGIAPGPHRLSVPQAVFLSGLLAGVSVACKLSNAPLVLLLPGLWALSGTTWPDRLRKMILGGIAALLGWGLTYGYWGWQLWQHFGNPVYPFYEAWFVPLQALLGWQA